MGDSLQQLKEKHPNNPYDEASNANPEFGDGAGRFGSDFGNSALAAKVNA